MSPAESWGPDSLNCASHLHLLPDLLVVVTETAVDLFVTSCNLLSGNSLCSRVYWAHNIISVLLSVDRTSRRDRPHGNLSLKGKASTFGTSSGEVKVFISPFSRHTSVTWFRSGRPPPLGMLGQRRRQDALASCVIYSVF
ncbi:unnamed protein product [Urochloa humidicola]